MERSENSQNRLTDTSKSMMELTRPSSKTAMEIAMNRGLESMKPEGERICYDPYAAHFINPDILEWEIRNLDKAKAMREERERLVPGSQNYFDDFVNSAIMVHSAGCYLPTQHQNFLLYD
ncbi:Uncharacterised protein [uncultured archaeon]|nr:Uncharacterised protein [uncultured archaeon]